MVVSVSGWVGSGLGGWWCGLVVGWSVVVLKANLGISFGFSQAEQNGPAAKTTNKGV